MREVLQLSQSAFHVAGEKALLGASPNSGVDASSLLSNLQVLQAGLTGQLSAAAAQQLAVGAPLGG